MLPNLAQLTISQNKRQRVEEDEADGGGETIVDVIPSLQYVALTQLLDSLEPDLILSACKSKLGEKMLVLTDSFYMVVKTTTPSNTVKIPLRLQKHDSLSATFVFDNVVEGAELSIEDGGMGKGSKVSFSFLETSFEITKVKGFVGEDRYTPENVEELYSEDDDPPDTSPPVKTVSGTGNVNNNWTVDFSIEVNLSNDDEKLGDLLKDMGRAGVLKFIELSGGIVSSVTVRVARANSKSTDAP